MIHKLARLIILTIFLFIIAVFCTVGYGFYKVSNGFDFSHGLSGMVHFIWTGKPLPPDEE
jgi:hypothetical protein